MSDQPESGSQPPPRTVTLSAAVYAQREGQILILERAMGEISGGWYIPGGAVDEGEGLEEAALRELLEETGLTPSGGLTLIGLVPMVVYGRESLQVTYACDCPTGEVAISAEHSGARWVDPKEYRDRYFNDEVIKNVTGANQRIGDIVRAVRDDLNKYLAWRDRQPGDKP